MKCDSKNKKETWLNMIFYQVWRSEVGIFIQRGPSKASLEDLYEI